MPIERMLTTTRAGEVDFAAKRIIEAHDGAPITGDTRLTSLFTDFKTSAGTLASVIEFSKAESDLEENDDLRDDTFGGVHGLTFGYTHHLDVTISNSAKNLFTIIDTHGRSVTQEPYALESSHLDAIIRELEVPAMVAAGKNLPGYEPLFAKLKTDELAFGKAFTAWKEKKGIDSLTIPATELKKGVIKELNEDICLHLDAMVKADPARYGKIATTIGQIITDSNMVVKARKKEKAKAE